MLLAVVHAHEQIRGFSPAHRSGLPEPRLRRDGDHGGHVDDPNGIPREHRIARLRPVDSRGHLDAKLLCQPGYGSIAAQRGAVILVGVVVISRCEPPGFAVCRLPGGIELVCCDAELDGTLGNGTLKSSSVCPVNRTVGAVVISEGAVRESVVLHPRHDLVQIGALEYAMPRRPRDNIVIRNKYLGIVARLGERLFRCDAVAVDVVPPHRELLGSHDEVRGRSGRPNVSEVGPCGAEHVSGSRDGTTLRGLVRHVILLTLTLS